VSTHPGHGAITLLPEFGLVFSPHQRILGAGYDGDVGASDEFEHPQRVRDFGLEPGIAGDHRDAEDFCSWRLDEQKH
jgi:hypothetical protein